MALNSSSTSAFILFILVAILAIHQSSAGGEGSLKKEQCGAACNYRCSATQYRNRCLEFCNYCCVRCLCVPSGTFGHKEECPCYNNMKTKEGGPKCP